MTYEEAVQKCENDLACGGFTFHGVKVPNRLYYIFFVHYVTFDGIADTYEQAQLWNTYRSEKKFIRLPGKPYIIHSKVAITDSEKVSKIKLMSDNAKVEWPLEKFMAAVYQNGKVYGFNQVILLDQNFDDKNSFTIIRNEKINLPKWDITCGSTEGIHKW